MSKYTPIGKHYARIQTIGGKPLGRITNIAELSTLVRQAYAEYGDSVRWEIIHSENGHTNRDGEYSPSFSSSLVLEAEFDTYSSEDYHSMFLDKMEKMLGTRPVFKRP